VKLPTDNLAIWLVRPESEPVAVQLHTSLGGEIFRPWTEPDQNQRLLFQSKFHDFSNWILVMATGIAVRFLDGLVRDKNTDPAVVVIDEAGRYAISLLSGHEGGANQLAFAAANVVSATPVITTATEALKSLILGVGCRKGISADQIEAAALKALGELSIKQIREVATIDLKAAEPGLREFCNRHDLPLRWFRKEDVAARAWSTQPSQWVRQVTGADGVCEPCALMTSPRARLLVPKSILNGVAVAIAEDNWRAVI
jgi:cobalt-precorrin 5A hydrolase